MTASALNTPATGATPGRRAWRDSTELKVTQLKMTHASGCRGFQGVTICGQPAAWLVERHCLLPNGELSGYYSAADRECRPGAEGGPRPRVRSRKATKACETV